MISQKLALGDLVEVADTYWIVGYPYPRKKSLLGVFKEALDDRWSIVWFQDDLEENSIETKWIKKIS